MILQDGQPVIEDQGCLGKMTNNQAEYMALIHALERAAVLGTHHQLLIRSDSELMVKQMRGEYRVKDPGLRPLYGKARLLWDRFDPSPKIVHVPRAQNTCADELCNRALDDCSVE